MNELMIKNMNDIVKSIDKQHSELLIDISQHLPIINQLSSNFAKTQSQFMDNVLTLSHPTPIRNIRQILAEMNKSIDALKEAYYKNKIQSIKIKILRRDIVNESDELKIELLEVEIEEKQSQLDTGKKYINGAIRKISNYKSQYQSILAKMEVDLIDEIDFETEEEQYHIKKAFEQALSAARSRGGIIDEGNHIYFSQLGINGTAAQKYVSEFLDNENYLFTTQKEPTFNNQLNFLEQMYQKFKNSATKYAEFKGVKLTNEISMLRCL